MRILLLGSFDFAGHIDALGHDVFTCGPDSTSDLCLMDQDPDWRTIAKEAQKQGLNFDAVVVCDNVGRRCLPTGMADCPAVTAFYGIDAPLNEFWQKPYSRLFDVALFDQPEQSDALFEIHRNVHWLPLGVDPEKYTGPAPQTFKPGVAFVGVVNPAVRPKRSALLDRISRIATLEIRGGRQGQWFSTKDAAAMYRAYQVVLNENLFPGFTTRPLEVMAAGGFLLSEGAPPAMTRHFKEFEHLLYFNPDNLEQRLELALSDSALRAALIQSGKQAVIENHTLAHRAAEIAGLLEAALNMPRQRPNAALALRLEGEAMMWAALRWPGKGGKRRLLRAAGRLRQAADIDHDTPDSLANSAMALAALGRNAQSLPLLLRAAESGGQRLSLQLAITAASLGRGDVLRQVAAQWQNGLSGLSKGPGRAEFHLAAAKLLLNEGADLTPGFNRTALPQQAWNAFEHLIEAAKLDGSLTRAFEMAGGILLRRGAPNEAHVMFARACALEASDRLQEKLRRAAKEGYLC